MTKKITDKMRLDWLARRTANLLWFCGARDGTCEVVGQNPTRQPPTIVGFGDTSRQAIDSAIRREAGGI